MPRYFTRSSLPSSALSYIHPLVPKPIINPLRARPTPAQHLLSLPTGTLPPNLRIHAETSTTLSKIPATVKFGGLKKREDLSVNDEGEVIRQLGKRARQKGGLLWALRER